MQELHQLLSLIQSSDILVAIKSIDPYLGKEFMGIGYDKYLHGALAFSIMWVFFGLLKRDLLSSVEIVVTLSVMKEIFDLFVKQTFFSY